MRNVFNIFSIFKKARMPDPPLSEEPEFEKMLEDFFSRETVAETKKALERLALPLPRGEREFMEATSGALLFLNDFGIVIRIEEKRDSEQCVDRQNPWVLQPLASFEAGDAVIEICPGCIAAKKDRQMERLAEEIRLSGGACFSDIQIANVGVLPYRTVRFPEGVPVVIDRPAVRKITRSVLDVKKALERMGALKDPQQALYGRLRATLENALQGKAAMSEFWQLCRQSVKEGVLVAGWGKDGDIGGAFYKQGYAASAAREYGRRLKNATCLAA